jgi:hypothetical protein
VGEARAGGTDTFVEWTAEGRLMHEAFLGLRTSARARCGEEWCASADVVRV